MKDMGRCCIIEGTQMTVNEWKGDHSIFRKCQLTPSKAEWGKISQLLNW